MSAASDDCIIAIDPGVKGGMACMAGEGLITLHGFTTEAEFLDLVSNVSLDTAEAVVEEVPPYVGRAIPSSSAFKLGYNYGFEVGVLRALGFRVNLVKPQVWQKGLQGLGKLRGSPRKRKLKDNAKRLYPKIKGLTLQTADALLLLDHWIHR